MAQFAYNRMWKDAQKDLDVLLQREREEFLQPEKDHEKVFRMLATCYIRYMQIFRNLETAHSQLLHQQKRAMIQQVMDGVIGRILEIKKEMVDLERSEFHYIDDLLEDLKLLPGDTEVPIPRYFLKERLEVLQQREKTLDQILLDAGLQAEKPVRTMPIETAIKVIQVAERARQGRHRAAGAAFIKRLHLKDERSRQAKAWAEMGLSPADAATRIQKVWRGYIQRKKMREEEMVFLGMSLPPHIEATTVFCAHTGPTDVPQREVQQNHLEAKSILQVGALPVNVQRGEVQERQEEVSIKDKLKETEGLSIKATLQEQIGQCFMECRHIAGRFPNYPTEQAGGSLALLSHKTPEQVAEKLAAQKKKSTQKGEGDKKGKGKAPRKTPQKSGKKEEEGWKMAPSNFLPLLEKGCSEYKVAWQNRDERWDLLQDHDPELSKEEKREEVEEEIRVQVDEVMRQKLEDLRLAVDGGKISKLKKGGKAAKVKTTVRKGITELEKDLTPDRTIDSLYRELVEEGLIIKAKTVHLHDYFGEHHYLGSILLQEDTEPVPSLAHIRQLIALYGILPLGSQTVHEKAPLVKSLLLAGPAGVGKKMLVHAICTETGANLFNLSASNIAGRNDLRTMFHMVLKVAKQLQPSVVWIGDTEKIFSKAAPTAEEGMKPKQLAEMLSKLLKALKAQDRVLLVGTTRRPFDADLKPFCTFYQKIIVIPKPDYSSRSLLWRNIIVCNGGAVTKALNISSLAKVSDGFTQGHIVWAVKAVLSELRLLLMTKKPLRAEEFVTPLAAQNPVYREEEEAFKAWYAKTPLGRARLKLLAATEKEQEPDAGKGKISKGKGKK